MRHKKFLQKLKDRKIITKDRGPAETVDLDVIKIDKSQK